MSSLVFYRQERVDGGTRTGIDFDGATLVENFEEGAEEENPALLWYVDVRCQGEHLPATAEAAIDWFRQHSGQFQEMLRAVATELSAGIDSEALPLRTQYPAHVPEAYVEVAVSGMRRVAGRNIAQRLRDTADHWNDLLDAVAVHMRV